MAVAVEGERDAAASDDLLQQVAAGVLGGAEQRAHDRAGGVVDGEQEGEARAALLEPGVVAAVDMSVTRKGRPPVAANRGVECAR